MNLTYKERLKQKYEQLSEGQRRVANVFFNNPELIAFTPAFEIGRDAGVSESTVIRLSQSLGYKGYAELQNIIQQELRDGRTLSQHKAITEVGNDRPFYKELFKEDIRNIKRTAEMLDQDNFEKAIQLVSDAKKIYVTGSLSSYGIASFLSHWLNMLFHHTELLSEKDTQYYTHLSRIDKDTLIIPITFPRYTKNTIELSKYAKQLDAKVLTITDSELSPISAHSDVMLISPVNTEIRIDSYTAPLSLVTSLIRSVAIKNDQQAENSLRKIEKVLHDNQVFHK